MEFKLNCSPHLRMAEITKKLFNNKFLSDVQFDIDGKIIYAHSLELMKRSAVFEQQLYDTCGEKNLILITDCAYESFVEFIRFLYTDECNIDDENGIDLLKLATKYQVIMLENRIINSFKSRKWGLRLFEHCVIGNYKLAPYYSTVLDGSYVDLDLRKEFLTLHPDAVNEILKFDAVDVSEIKIFETLADWINNYCQQHQITLTEGRERFDNLIRKIRFPTMSIEEIRKCFSTYTGLLSESDCLSIAKQLFFTSDDVKDVWISKRRTEYISSSNYCELDHNITFETIFSVSSDTILSGLWIGNSRASKFKEIKFKITAKDIKTNKSENVVFKQSCSELSLLLISLGGSILLMPNFEYTIDIKYLGVHRTREISVRKPNVDVDYEDPENCVKIRKASNNVIKLFFKSPSAE